MLAINFKSSTKAFLFFVSIRFYVLAFSFPFSFFPLCFLHIICFLFYFLTFYYLFLFLPVSVFLSLSFFYSSVSYFFIWQLVLYINFFQLSFSLFFSILSLFVLCCEVIPYFPTKRSISCKKIVKNIFQWNYIKITMSKNVFIGSKIW